MSVSDGVDTAVATTSVVIENGCYLSADCDETVDLGGVIGIDLVLIPSGSDPLGRYDITNDFYMMTTEVTQGMYTSLMSYDPTTYSTTYGVRVIIQPIM